MSGAGAGGRKNKKGRPSGPPFDREEHGRPPLATQCLCTIGMGPEVQARIYERFYRAPAARSLEARGLGLGLSLVQRLIHAHAGRIELESAPDQGSSFRVYLPVVTGESERADG